MNCTLAIALFTSRKRIVRAVWRLALFLVSKSALEKNAQSFTTAGRKTCRRREASILKRKQNKGNT